MVFLVMLSVVACYSLCALNDRYAVSRVHLDRRELTLLMSAGTAVFLGAMAPFLDLSFERSWLAILPPLLIAACKYLEFAMLPRILQRLSPFELKAWVGLTLFLSFFTDVLFFGAAFSPLCLMFILLSAAGLWLTARSGGSTDYRGIGLTLGVYVLTKFSYGCIMRATAHLMSNALTLLMALLLLVLATLPGTDLRAMTEKSDTGLRGILIVLAAKLPNALGLLGENYTASQSLVNYSFIQPLILITLFITALRDRSHPLSSRMKAGGIVLAVGVLGFQAARLMS